MLLFTMGAGHYWIGQRVKKTIPVGLIVIGVLSIIFIGFNIKQNTYWRDEIPLFERTLSFEKDFGRARFLLAKAYSAAGRYEEAIREDRKALAIMRRYEQKAQEEAKKFYAGYMKGIYYHLGYCFDILGNPKEALAEFKNALSLAPENGSIQYSVGLSYLKLDDIQNAITHFEKSLELNEEDLMVMSTLAVCYQDDGRYTEAERLLRTIAERDGRSISAKRNLENFLKKKQIGQ